MSYFCFGSVLLRDESGTSKVSLPWQIVNSGLRNKVSLLIGDCIIQHIVKEMLDKQGEKGLRFLATASPLDDTSEGLVIPYVRFDKGWRSTVEAKINSISECLSEILSISMVDCVHLYFSEGYAEDFQEIQTTPCQLTGTVMTHVDECGDVGPLKIVVRDEKHDARDKQQ